MQNTKKQHNGTTTSNVKKHQLATQRNNYQYNRDVTNNAMEHPRKM